MRLTKTLRPNLTCKNTINTLLCEAYNNRMVAEIRFICHFEDNNVSCFIWEKKQTLRLEAKLMIDRWRSLFLCAGVNSGREAALSAARKKK